MRCNRFLLSTCAAICLALPAAGLAAPPGDQQDHKAGKGVQGHGRAAGGSQAGQGADRSGSAGIQGGQRRFKLQQGGVSGPGVAASGQVGVKAGQVQLHGQQGVTAQGQASQSFRRAQTGPGQNPRVFGHSGPVVRQAPQARTVRPIPIPSPLGGWDRNARGPDRQNAGEQWRQQHRNWDQGALWRRDPNWWRRDPGFRLFNGLRLGFFFVPDYGYYAPPLEYRAHYWRAGDILPSWFWRFKVRNYWRYGLPTPPPGCAWVWVDDDVALIDLDDGYILDIVRSVW